MDLRTVVTGLSGPKESAPYNINTEKSNRREKQRMLEKMSDFFTARIEGYDQHMLNEVEGCKEGYRKMAESVAAGNRSPFGPRLRNRFGTG